MVNFLITTLLKASLNCKSSCCDAILEIKNNHPQVQFVYPVHFNPNVREVVNRKLSTTEGIFLVEPLDYPRLIWIMEKSTIILTDSGGIQEEAPALGKPVLVMRDSTERPEAVASGAAALVGTSTESILNKTEDLLNNSESYNLMAKTKNPYGDGTAANKIALILSRVSI